MQELIIKNYAAIFQSMIRSMIIATEYILFKMNWLIGLEKTVENI